MDAELGLSPSEARLLASLASHGVNFMIVGLSAAALQGAPVVTQDVDLWFEDLHDPKFRTALKAVNAAYVPPFELNPPMLAGEGSELFDLVLRVDGLGGFKEEINNTIEFSLLGHRIKALRLDRIIRSKEAANRPKDQLSLPVLKDCWKGRG